MVIPVPFCGMQFDSKQSLQKLLWTALCAKIKISGFLNGMLYVYVQKTEIFNFPLFNAGNAVTILCCYIQYYI